MENVIIYIYQILNSYAFLMIAAIGLAIIYGMMGVINLAHGEFIMLGAYITTILGHAGVPLPLAILCSTIGVAIYGVIIDLLFVHRLYNRPLDSIVATWGLSLLMSQMTQIIFGPSMSTVAIPLGTIEIMGLTFSGYRVMIICVSIILPVMLYLIFSKTRFGLESRATMQKPLSAGLLGTNTRRMYSLTFMIGSAFAGFAGGLYAPTVTIAPTMGQFFQMQSFVTVVVGGLNPLVGAVSASSVLGVINGVVSYLATSFLGRIALLVFAILLLRVLPGGLSDLATKMRNRRMELKK